MKKKPLSIRVISLLFLLAPFANVLLISYFRRWPLSGPRGVLAHLSGTEWAILSVFPIVSFGIWRVKPWGYFACMGFAAFLISHNTYAFLHDHHSYTPYLFILFQLSTFAAIGLLLHSHFAAPYFKPKMRWWETAPRHTINVHGRIRQGTTVIGCSVLDISTGGCFVELEKDFKISEKVWMDIAYMDLHVTCKVEVIWQRVNPTKGYGFHFVAMDSTSRKSLKRILIHLTRTEKKSVARGRKNDSIAA